MARIVYKEGYEPLSGIYCNMLYKNYANGKATAFVQAVPSEDEALKNPAARAERVIKLCVADIQEQMHNQREAMAQYTNITHRVRRLYKELHEWEENNNKLKKMILNAYYQSRRVLPSRKVKSKEIEFES